MYDAIVGGALVLVGVLVTQVVNFLSLRSDRKERRNRLLREKYEELCQSILEANQQVQEMARPKTIEEVALHLPPSAPLRVHYLAIIYFPEMREASSDYNNAVVVAFRYLLSCFDSSIQESMGSQVMFHPETRAEYKKLAEEILLKRAILENLIEVHAEKYTQA